MVSISFATSSAVYAHKSPGYRAMCFCAIFSLTFLKILTSTF